MFVQSLAFDKKDRSKKVAGTAFWVHKNMGYYFELFTMLHVGAAFYHVVKGFPIFSRFVGPFGWKNPLKYKDAATYTPK